MLPTTDWAPVTFKPVRYRRGSQLRAGVGALGFGIFAFVLASDQTNHVALLTVGGIFLIVVGVVFLIGWRGQTTIDGQGLSTTSPFGRHSCRWSEIADIRLDVDGRGDTTTVDSTIKIDLHAGRTFTLPVPRDRETGTHHDNPDLPDQLAMIRRYWQANSSQ